MQLTNLIQIDRQLKSPQMLLGFKERLQKKKFQRTYKASSRGILLFSEELLKKRSAAICVYSRPPHLLKKIDPHLSQLEMVLEYCSSWNQPDVCHRPKERTITAPKTESSLKCAKHCQGDTNLQGSYCWSCHTPPKYIQLTRPLTFDVKRERCDGLTGGPFDVPRAQHQGCFPIKNCCWGPITEPGRQIRIHAMLSAAVTPNSFIIQQAISVPVLPSPA